MFATPPILFVLGLLAQAEAAPAEIPPVPAAPDPPVASHPAAPMPPPALPPASEPESPMKIGFRAGADFALAADITPEVGYDFSPFFQYELVRFAEKFGLAARAESTFNRFAKTVTIPPDPAFPNRNSNQRTLSYLDFSALAIATLHLGPVIPWLGTGAGVTLTQFSTHEPEYLPGDWSHTRLLLVGALGVDVIVTGHVQIGLHGEYRGMVNRPTYALDDGRSIKPLGDRLGVQAAVMYQF